MGHGIGYHAAKHAIERAAVQSGDSPRHGVTGAAVRRQLRALPGSSQEPRQQDPRQDP
jgi:hypothetical protein